MLIVRNSKMFKTDLKSKIVSTVLAAFSGLLERMMISRDSQNCNKLGCYCLLPPREATSDV